jgi:hypothetical protein
MKQIFILIAITITTAFSAEAKIWRVNNNTGVSADFTNPQPAHDAASAGDTLLIEPSQTTYGDINITKKIIVLGSGYFLKENLGKQLTTYNSNVGAITFGDNYSSASGSYNTLISSSNGSSISGLEAAQIQIHASNIAVTRCKTGYISVESARNNGQYLPNANITITQNYIENSLSVLPAPYISMSDVFIKNNIIKASTSIKIGNVNNLSLPTRVLVENNILYAYSPSLPFIINNTTFQNNIIIGGATTFTGQNATVSNNVFNSTFGTGSGYNPGLTYTNNLSNVDMLTVFVADPAPSTVPTGFTSDNRYKIKAGSPTIGAGNTGGDTGIFSGGNPYILSGIPAIPSIYEYIVPSPGQNSLNIKMSVSSNP